MRAATKGRMSTCSTSAGNSCQGNQIFHHLHRHISANGNKSTPGINFGIIDTFQQVQKVTNMKSINTEGKLCVYTHTHTHMCLHIYTHTHMCNCV